MTRYRVEIEQTILGWVEVEAEVEEPPEAVRTRVQEAVEDEVLIPRWTDDFTVHTCRLYDADLPCRQQVGAMTRYCGVHDEPMVEGLDKCQRRVDDLAEQEDPAQSRLWGS
jgi:hypothetical protein